MGYFDSLTENHFKTDFEGRSIYYRWGVLGKGYVLSNKTVENKLRQLIKVFYFVAMVTVIGVAVSIGWFYELFLVPLLLVWYQLYTGSLIKEFPTVEVSSFQERLANYFTSYSLTRLWCMLIGSIFFVVAGILIALFDSESAFLGVFSALFFGACGIIAFLGIQVKKRIAQNEEAR
ncbi:MAG: hypothetical protein HQM14_06200 [SAR324 cluster bacterium]|nr:hypothetical protein [SAR324 cluster bacterium]